MALSRRSFLKRLGGSLAAIGVGAKLVEALPEVAATTTSTEAITVWMTNNFSDPKPTYIPGYLYYSHDEGKTWTLATHEDWDGMLGVAVSPTELQTHGIVRNFQASYWTQTT